MCIEKANEHDFFFFNNLFITIGYKSFSRIHYKSTMNLHYNEFNTYNEKLLQKELRKPTNFKNIFSKILIKAKKKQKPLTHVSIMTSFKNN